MDKVDGPYYFFPAMKLMRDTLPAWLPLVGVDLGDTNVVPVDYVAKAMDHLAHLEGRDGEAFHLVNPEPQPVVDMVNAFCGAAGAPPFATPVDRQHRAVACSGWSRAPLRPLRARQRPWSAPARSRPLLDQTLGRLGIPAEVLAAHVVPAGLRLAPHREGAGRLRHRRARPRVLRPHAVGLLGGEPRRSRPAATPAPARR